MAWRGVYDQHSFLAPLRKRRAALDAALDAPGLDSDAALRLVGEIDQLRDFIEAIKRVQGPAAELVPLSAAVLGTADLYMLRFGDWRAYYVLSATQSMFYGALVTHPSMPAAKRLDELQLPPDEPA